jgi:hypothetical protein
VGISPEVYGRLERGLMMPSVPTLVEVASVLRASPNELLGWESLRQQENPPEAARLGAIISRADRPTLRRILAMVEAAIGLAKPEMRARTRR